MTDCGRKQSIKKKCGQRQRRERALIVEQKGTAIGGEVELGHALHWRMGRKNRKQTV